MVILLTATVYPDNRMGQLQLKSSEIRLMQYQQALLFYLQKTNANKIVLCDNSGVSLDKFEEQKVIAQQAGKELELLSFVGDKEVAVQRGKGYGEGEIIKFAMKNSALINKDKDIVKITGRLIVRNIDTLMKGYRGKPTFNIAEHTEANRVDTRIFMVSKDVFEEHFIDRYEEVHDDKGVFLEQVYYECITRSELKVERFARYPRIRGYSGSTGAEYTFKEWKCKIKDILEVLGYFIPR